MKFSYIQQSFFFALLIATSAIFLWMIGSYLMPVFWAIVIAIVFFPLHNWFEKKLNGRASLAAVTTLSIFVLIIVLPLSFIGGMIVQESLGVYKSISENGNSFNGSSLVSRAVQATSYLEPYGITQDAVEERLKSWAASASKVIANSIVTFSQVTFKFIIQVSIMLYIAFFFLRDGKRLQQTLLHYLPLGDAHEKRLLKRFSETTRAVVKGTIAIAALQGFIISVLFLVMGIPNPVLWGVAVAVLAIIPAVGPALIWVPAGIILMATGSFWSGIIVLVVGALLVSLVDEFLRPILVGRGSKMPDALTLLATIGGLATFGISGFVVGPIIAAFFLSLWKMFEEKYHTELSENA